MNKAVRPVMAFDVDIYRGFDRGPFTFQYSDQNKIPIDLTSQTIRLTVKDPQTHATLFTQTSPSGGITIPTPANGQFILTYLGSNTGSVLIPQGIQYIEVVPATGDSALVATGNLQFRS